MNSLNTKLGPAKVPHKRGSPDQSHFDKAFANKNYQFMNIINRNAPFDPHYQFDGRDNSRVAIAHQLDYLGSQYVF